MSEQGDTRPSDKADGFRLAYGIAPRGDEAALWTLICAVGQFVLGGWSLSMAALTFLLALGHLHSYEGFPSWLSRLIAAFFFAISAVLLGVGARFVLRSAQGVWVAWRKVWFILSYYRHLDIARAQQEVEGDPLLEEYLRYLVRRGILKPTDEAPEEQPL